jgi:hypothetical protein
MEKMIRNQVDLMLYEEGSFSPLNWLIHEGVLDYADYLQWRNGEVDFLEGRFKASIEKIIHELTLVDQYARLLQLGVVLLPYLSDKGVRLYISRDPAREKIYTSVYEPAKDRMQMDLFYDSSPACTVNDLVLAIINNHHDDIAALLSRLESLDVDKYQQFEQLLAARGVLLDSGKNYRWKIKALEQKLTPLALSLLGRFAHDFLAPLWREISTAINELEFDPRYPDLHLSYTAMRGFQWREVVAASAREAEWLEQSVLMFRYAEAQFKLHHELEGLRVWFRFFLFYPDQAEQYIGNTCNRLLLSEWQAFLELEPELEKQFFASWVLLQRPALAGCQMGFNNSTPAVESLLLIRKLLNSGDDGLNADVVRIRAELKQQNSALFIHMMNAMGK